ncbi:hypothetical protein FYK55_26825 [Roseiconus nitratireducens]|uniref:Uncharacterized protein n=1 Tax=Roseiconus nitratireducens TaxID=2605748 RepID=A0A5M6CZ88_9BACT|nr:hypothetical protein [Roseiconus nitratireducens]KAA5538629.1 hypothetical protein FYK55_26825 [Roseiconus nitratireducens]
MNPYNAPTPRASNVRIDEPKNPAKPLLILVGGLYAATSPVAILSGLQAGLHLVAAGIAMLVLGGATILLALRNFNALFRNATIVWGCCLVAFFAWASFSAYDAGEVVGAVFFGIVLLVVTPIPILAIRQPACRHANSSRAITNGEPSDARESLN